MKGLTTFSDIPVLVKLQSHDCGFDTDKRADIPIRRDWVHELDHVEIDPDIRPTGSHVSFCGFRDVGGIADVQFGGTCWAEAIQKAIQLVVGDRKGELNNLSAEIIARVFLDPEKWDAVENTDSSLAIERFNIPSSRYPDMFREFGVDAENMSFSHEVLKNTLADHRPALIAGNVRHLDGLYGVEDGNHVLVVVDWNEATQRYTLLDSNFDHVYEVSPKTLENFAKGDFAHKVADFIEGQMTVVKTPSEWTDWRKTLDVNVGNGQILHFVDGHLSASFEDFQRFAGNHANDVATTQKRGVQKHHGNVRAGEVSFGRSGDADLDHILDEATQLRRDIRADFEAAGGIQGKIKRGLERWTQIRSGLENYIRQTLSWLDRASPEEVRRYAGNIEIEKMKIADESERMAFIQKMTEWKERQIKFQTQEQFDAEKKGYHQVFPAYLSDNWGKDHNIFEKNGAYYRLIPGTGGMMESITKT